MGGKDRSDGVGMFIEEKWVDSVLKVERHTKGRKTVVVVDVFQRPVVG